MKTYLAIQIIFSSRLFSSYKKKTIKVKNYAKIVFI